MELIKHVFFDLDHTLWHFDMNAEATLLDIYERFELKSHGVGKEFLPAYFVENERMWDLYRNDLISQKELRNSRFKNVFHGLIGDNDIDAQAVSDYYIAECPKQPNLIPGAIDVLEALKGKYQLHIITNGFNEVQATKMATQDLASYFKSVTSSQEAGVKKPNPKIFDCALERSGAKREESVYIGDSYLVDLKGALDAGWNSAIWFNYHENLNHTESKTMPAGGYEVAELTDILNILV